jgi:hypothetical protein
VRILSDRGGGVTGANHEADDEPAAVRSAGEGIAHLQRAAGELIAAARSFLDAADAVVKDPSIFEEGLRRAAAHGRRAASPDDEDGYESVPLS